VEQPSALLCTAATRSCRSRRHLSQAATNDGDAAQLPGTLMDLWTGWCSSLYIRALDTIVLKSRSICEKTRRHSSVRLTASTTGRGASVHNTHDLGASQNTKNVYAQNLTDLCDRQTWVFVVVFSFFRSVLSATHKNIRFC
jgi:hypothetical protein